MTFLGINSVTIVCRQRSGEEFDCLEELATSEEYNLIMVGICLEGVGVVMIFTHVLQYFRLDPTIGAVYVAIRKCITTVTSFIITYSIITFAFGLGMHFILKVKIVLPLGEPL